MAEEGVIKEGFLCPACHADMRSPKNLLIHFEEAHSEEQDKLKTLKELFGKAKSKILKVDERDLETLRADVAFQRYFLEEGVPQAPGQTQSHMDYFRKVRRERLDHRTSETNKLIIRLDRLLRAEGSDRKQTAQELVPWLDGTTVTRCPSCTASFNFARRQHHCRLCGSIMCNSCSFFMTYEEARCIIKPMYSDGNGIAPHDNSETLRICNHCERMLENRKQVQLNQSRQPLLCKLYEELKRKKNDIDPSVDLYCKMFTSLTSGDTMFQLQDAQSLKTAIARQAETLDSISKHIASIPPDADNPKAYSLQTSVRRATSAYIKDRLITLPPLPTPAELERIKHERYSCNSEAPSVSNIRVEKVAVTTGWSPANVSTDAYVAPSEDPIMEQINIVRNYIEQARSAQRFEEVTSLRRNLKDLKDMYEKQVSLRNTDT